MSVSPLSSHLLADSSQQQWKIPFEGYVKQLASALQSGDLSEAQTTYAKIQQILQANRSSPASKINLGGSNALQNDFAALGQILQAGDLSQAQSTFSKVQSDLQAKDTTT
jgi:hypothetical protein